jgi:hypothetical protein
MARLVERAPVSFNLKHANPARLWSGCLLTLTAGDDHTASF